MNISASTLSRYETNPQSISLPVFRAMCELYGIPRDISNKVIYHSSTISRKKLSVKKSVDDYGDKSLNPVYLAYKADPTFFFSYSRSFIGNQLLKKRSSKKFF
ncbi:helix-turn-helix transcriptional regulator [Paenisporosarcina sp. HGH0030]|uniref:helix-turn-helix domain-containing protein n=1 Tax=Paenisporosarcina sp. HGH0030 TaxID=1078085 RepID=UPI0009DB75C7